MPNLGGTSLKRDKHYDQIAFTGPANETHMLNHGVIDWQQAVFTEDDADKYRPIAEEMRGKPYTNWKKQFRSWTTHEMSDHLPIWIEIAVDYSNDYLRRIAEMEPS